MTHGMMGNANGQDDASEDACREHSVACSMWWAKANEVVGAAFFALRCERALLFEDRADGLVLADL